MSIMKTIGGDRLGSGKKMKVELPNYGRSSHDLSYLWRSTMAAGTLVPFLHEIALPGDTFDIDLNCNVMTHPTVGPLFGSYKVQLDVFQAPIRLYNALLHNNMLGIGMKMSQVKFPTITFTANWYPEKPLDIDNAQVNPSALPAYLGMRGIGYIVGGTDQQRSFNAIPYLAYWEIYKNYYANKQEKIGAVLHTPTITVVETVSAIKVHVGGGAESTIDQYPSSTPVTLQSGTIFRIYFSGPQPIPEQIKLYTVEHGWQTLDYYCLPFTLGTGYLQGYYDNGTLGNSTADYWDYIPAPTPSLKPSIATFDLSNIDDMRNAILAKHDTTAPFNINTDKPIEPYKWLYEQNNGYGNILSSQEGLALKTYQNDLFNNWIDAEYITGPGSVSDITAISTSSGSFTIDTFLLSKKVFDMLNNIAVSGGSYDDWQEAVYAHEQYGKAESPMYMGGLIKELTFQEVVSNAATATQPLGTLAGRGTMTAKHKGGKIIIKVDEPSYIIGIVSITPRIDYSQGNKWDIHLQTMDDLHKPALDEIGFQDLITEQLAWWDTHGDGSTTWETHSAGKQPAWINYMTNVNELHGNFAVATNEMFMTLNRRYEFDATTDAIKDLTTYIDPSKYNNIFAQTSLDSQNFWTQIAINMTARRKMSAKIMPSLG